MDVFIVVAEERGAIQGNRGFSLINSGIRGTPLCLELPEIQ
jgi:hypothetical protein